MIFGTADFHCLKFVIASDAGNVGPEFGLNVFAQAFFAIFSAEDYVDSVA